MKITRNQFLKLIPAAALTLTSCGSKAQPANTESLVFSHHYQLDYAQQFTADCYEGGYTMLTIAESDARFLVVPEDAAEVDGLPADVTVLRQPVENIYLVSTSVMDLLLHLDALDSVAFSGTKAEGWYLPEVQQAMEEGKIAYAGKYSAPDYEQILAAGCRLAIENTMILHTPEVKEQLEHFGIPVLVERSSYESDPLARMEWIKLYGILLGTGRTGRAGVFRAGDSRSAHPLAGTHGKKLRLLLADHQQPCHGAQRQRLCGPHDRDGGRQLCLCGPDGQW